MVPEEATAEAKIETYPEGRRPWTVSIPGGLVYELPVNEAFDKRDGAEQAVCTMALLQLFPEQPLYRLLPPAYRSLWLRWADEAKAPEQQEAAAALVARDKFIAELCNRPRDPTRELRIKRRKVVESEAAAPSAAPTHAPNATPKELLTEEDEARMARERQEAAEKEEEAMLLEEEREMREEEERPKRSRWALHSTPLHSTPLQYRTKRLLLACLLQEEEVMKEQSIRLQVQ